MVIGYALIDKRANGPLNVLYRTLGAARAARTNMTSVNLRVPQEERKADRQRRAEERFRIVRLIEEAM